MLPLLLYAERDRGQWKITQFGLQKHIGFNASYSTSSAMLTVFNGEVMNREGMTLC